MSPRRTPTEPNKPGEPDFGREKPSQTIITKENVLVSGTILVSAIGLTIAMMAIFYGIKADISALRSDNISIRKEISEKWSLSQERERHNLFWRDNPTLKMESSNPDVISARIR